MGEAWGLITQTSSCCPLSTLASLARVPCQGPLSFQIMDGPARAMHTRKRAKGGGGCAIWPLIRVLLRRNFSGHLLLAQLVSVGSGRTRNGDSSPGGHKLGTGPDPRPGILKVKGKCRKIVKAGGTSCLYRRPIFGHETALLRTIPRIYQVCNHVPRQASYSS